MIPRTPDSISSAVGSFGQESNRSSWLLSSANHVLYSSQAFKLSTQITTLSTRDGSTFVDPTEMADRFVSSLRLINQSRSYWRRPRCQRRCPQPGHLRRDRFASRCSRGRDAKTSADLYSHLGWLVRGQPYPVERLTSCDCAVDIEQQFVGLPLMAIVCTHHEKGLEVAHSRRSGKS